MPLTKLSRRFLFEKLSNNQVMRYKYEIEFIFLPIMDKLFQTEKYNDFVKSENKCFNKYRLNHKIRNTKKDNRKKAGTCRKKTGSKSEERLFKSLFHVIIFV